jgi:hypothetical protein
MKRLTTALLIGACVVAVAAVSSAPAGAAEGGTDRPYTASGDGINVVDVASCRPVADGLECDQEIYQTVIGTHIGLSTRATTGTITLDFDAAGSCTGPAGPPQFGVPFLSIQDGTITAANGDQLFYDETVTGCYVAEGIDAQPSGTYTIEGGTGRFDGATGAGTLAGATFGVAGLTTEWTGTISY